MTTKRSIYDVQPVSRRQFLWDTLCTEAELDDRTVTGRMILIAKLKALYIHERQRGLAGAWTYDHNKHRRIFTYLKTEQRQLEEITG